MRVLDERRDAVKVPVEHLDQPARVDRKHVDLKGSASMQTDQSTVSCRVGRNSVVRTERWLGKKTYWPQVDTAKRLMRCAFLAS